MVRLVDRTAKDTRSGCHYETVAKEEVCDPHQRVTDCLVIERNNTIDINHELP